MDAPASALACLAHSVQKEAPVLVIRIDNLAPVAARHDMVKGTRELKTKTAWHV
jgi:hypothetical protein